MDQRVASLRSICGLLFAAAVISACHHPAPPASSQERPRAPVRALLTAPRVDHKTQPVVTPKPLPPPPTPAPVPRPPVGVPIAGPVPDIAAIPTENPQRPHQPQQKQQQPPSRTELLLRSYQQGLARGFIDYNAPAQMTVGTADTIVVRVLRNKLPALAAGGPAPTLPGPETSASLSVYPSMRVALTSNSGAAFAITPDPASPATQTIPDSGYAEWRWQVMPLLAGPGKTLVVTAWANLSDQNLDPILIQEYLAEVNVLVAPRPSLPKRLGIFVANNWQWLWTAILIPVVGWLVGRFSRRKKPEQ